MVRLLCRAHAGIEKMMEVKNPVKAMELLEQCQKGAVRLGELIEQAEGEGFATVHMLEDYCELVYQIYEEIGRGLQDDGSLIYQKLQECMGYIENSIRQDIKVSLEVVFLPYRAEKWDFMESIWEAAQADPLCTAYVIPMPYYYKNISGVFQEMQYDGEEYPAHVPVTRYDDFDFGQHLPDVIFMQNPYDAYNSAVSVHPFFYSSNLKKFTERLIYVPCFMLDEFEKEDERAWKNMRYFAAMPGVANADKVMVQSEGVRRLYIDFLTNEAGENTRALWEQKITAAGSPKQDKERRNTGILGIPKEWEEMIKKKSGGYKKVLLYGTSMSVLSQYGEQYLEKLQNVIFSFVDKQEEAVIWWRPQPLSMLREALLPEKSALYLKYEELVKNYQNKKIGIYDETAEEERAAELCDAYYGDGGSMLRFFYRQQKPIMIQGMEV